MITYFFTKPNITLKLILLLFILYTSFFPHAQAKKHKFVSLSNCVNQARSEQKLSFSEARKYCKRQIIPFSSLSDCVDQARSELRLSLIKAGEYCKQQRIPFSSLSDCVDQARSGLMNISFIGVRKYCQKQRIPFSSLSDCLGQARSELRLSPIDARKYCESQTK